MTTTMLIKLDKGLKEKAQKTAKYLGLPLSTVVSGYLKKFVTEKEITFSHTYIPNVKTIKIIEQARRDYKAGKTVGPFETAEAAIAHLKKYR